MQFIQPLVDVFPGLHIERLPHCFVHGDIIATNVIKANDNRLFVIDFAIASWYPRIQELAVLLCDLLYSEDDNEYLANYNLALSTYQEEIRLEKREIDLLPTYIKLAHAMHIVPATREMLKGNQLPENSFLLESGQKGIRVANRIWN